jgi:rhodanese-related sulfurtransferase
MKTGLRVLSPFGLVQLVMAAAVGTALWLAFEPWQWGRLKDEVRQRFPGIPKITGEELTAWMRKSDSTQPLLLDARAEAEFNTSHLPGARRAGSTLTELGIEGKLGSPLVVYCRAGFESGAVAQTFINRGYTRVQMLEGGIFLWANERRQLVSASGPTDKVLPGDSPHSGMLHSSRTAH